MSSENDRLLDITQLTLKERYNRAIQLTHQALDYQLDLMWPMPTSMEALLRWWHGANNREELKQILRRKAIAREEVCLRKYFREKGYVPKAA